MPVVPAPDATTIAACSTALAGLMCIAVLLSWVKDGLPAPRRWQFAPFGIAVPTGILLTWPELLPGAWGLHLGWFGLTAVYGTVWLAVRVTAGREARPLAMLLPCLAVLLFSCTIAADGPAAAWRMLPRTLLFAAFNGLAAREIARMRAPHLPSATMLYGIFAVFCAVDLVRSPFSLILPAPFGPGEVQVWSIALFNLAIALEGVLLGVSLIALGREQVAARHYRLAHEDPLTGIGNRRALEFRLDAVERARATGQRFGLAVIDIDHFKAVNDELGHDFGDVVIAGAARLARETFGTDTVFRTGGEEFAVVVAAPDDADVLRQCEAMRTAFARHLHVMENRERRCTVSIGMAVLDGAETVTARFKAADRALYAAKRLGRNRTILAETEPQASAVPVARAGTVRPPSPRLVASR